MSHRIAGPVLTGIVVTAWLSCANPTEPYVAAGTIGRVHVALGSSRGDWHTDALRVDSARVDGDVLNVHVNHGGGCADHEYAAIAWNGWLESDPVQVGTLIGHRDHDDPCDAVIYAHLEFDLLPLREAYMDAYGPGPATLIVRLESNPPDAGDPILVNYTF